MKCAAWFSRYGLPLLNELGYNRDWIKRQFAHAPTEQIHRITTEPNTCRTPPYASWADYLDGLRAKARKEVDLE